MSKSPALIHDSSQYIITVRGQTIILDLYLSQLYGVPTKVLNQAVKRNQSRFPQEFMFQLSKEEAIDVRSQIVTLQNKRHFRYLPYAFTEHGALMAANILNSPQAIKMSVAIVQAFVRLRRLTLSVEEISKRVNTLEYGLQQHDEELKEVFAVIQELMTPSNSSSKKIGFCKD